MDAAVHHDPIPILLIIGEVVALRPQHRGLSPLVHRWLNDAAVAAPLGASLHPLSAEAAARLYDDSEAADDQLWFAVYERVSLRPLGITGLRDIDHRHRTAEFVIFLGEKQYWGKGYGAETARLMLEYGFERLGLHSIMLKVYAFNVRGIRAYRRAGFREIGRRRAAHHVAGNVHDVILMDCLASEFSPGQRQPAVIA